VLKKLVNNKQFSGFVLLCAFIMMIFSVLIVKLCAFKNTEYIMNTATWVWVPMVLFGLLNGLRLMLNK
jgi:hypothetical protein